MASETGRLKKLATAALGSVGVSSALLVMTMGAYLCNSDTVPPIVGIVLMSFGAWGGRRVARATIPEVSTSKETVPNFIMCALVMVIIAMGQSAMFAYVVAWMQRQ